jgi:hypothetical protein
MSGPKLFDIVAQANHIERQIVEASGELSAELEAALAQVDLALAEKVDGYSAVMVRLDAAAEYWKVRADELARVARSVGAARDRIKEAVKAAMQAMGKDEVSGNEVRFNLSKVKPRLVIDDAALDPAYKMQVTETVTDKERVRLALEEGFEVRGARLESSVSLRSYATKKEK